MPDFNSRSPEESDLKNEIRGLQDQDFNSRSPEESDQVLFFQQNIHKPFQFTLSWRERLV